MAHFEVLEGDLTVVNKSKKVDIARGAKTRIIRIDMGRTKLSALQQIGSPFIQN